VGRLVVDVDDSVQLGFIVGRKPSAISSRVGYKDETENQPASRRGEGERHGWRFAQNSRSVVNETWNAFPAQVL
jgi:hypothetical protein